MSCARWLPLSLVALCTACGATSSPSPPATSGNTQPTAGAEVNSGGDIPDTQQFVAFPMPSGAFTVTIPEGWARSQNGPTVMFASHFDSVALSTIAMASAPTLDWVTSHELATIRQQSANVAGGQASIITRTAGQAILLTYRADSAPDAVTGNVAHLEIERYDFWRNGVEAVITLAAPAGADNVDAWRMITDSFTWH